MKKYLFLLGVSPFINAFAQESQLSSLEQLLNTPIKSASRYEQPLIDAPNQSQVITDKDIKSFGFRTMGEALQSLNGVYMNSQKDYSYIGIRGFHSPGDYNTRLLMLKDGVRLNDPLYDSALIGHESPIDIDWIKHIEYVSGPSSSQYGSNALLGVTNLVTYSGSDIQGTKIKTEYQSDGVRKMTVLHGQGINKEQDYIIGVSASNSKGEDIYFPSAGWARGLDGERYAKAYAKINFSDWRLDLGGSQRNKNIPTAYWGTEFNASGTYVTDNYYYINATQHKNISHNLSQQIRYHLNKYDYSGHYNYGASQSTDSGHSQWLGAEYSLDYQGIDRHRIVSGIEFQSSYKLSQSNETSSLNKKNKYFNYNSYIQDQFTISPKLVQYLGVRLDHVNQENSISPKFALIYKPRSDTALRFSISQAFRPPNMYERYYDEKSLIPGSIKSNENLRNEHLKNYEVNIEHAISSNNLLSISIYQYELRDAITQTINQSGYLQFVNQSLTQGHGIELGDKHKTDNYSIYLAGAMQNTINHEGLTVNSPKFIGKLLLETDIPSSNLKLNLQTQTNGSSYNAEAKNIGGYTTSNLIVNQKSPKPYGNFSMGIYNFFNKKYATPASSEIRFGIVPQDKRTYRINWELNL